jgi:hypothetical protein
VANDRSNTARSLVTAWGLDVQHALYRKSGDWYHQLVRFPGALMDEHGYVVFETEEAYRQCPALRIRQDVAVPRGISQIPGYTLGLNAMAGQRTTYERAVFAEGGRRDVIQSRIERSGPAREACIAAHGLKCAVCGFDFAAVYGDLGAGFIHVHHCKPVSLEERPVDPVAEMRPLCPNCHAMVHRQDPPLSIERLRSILGRGP